MTTTPKARGIARKAVSLLLTLATALGMMTLGVPTAAADNRGILRPGCQWAKYNFFVQNCDVYSPSMGQNIRVQIKAASRGGNAGLYLLDGLRARDDWNAWTYQGFAPNKFVDDDVTLVMPVGGQAQFYADWIGPWAGSNGPAKPRWETFLTSELPVYLQKNFGVSRNNNAIVGLSMGGTAAMNLAAHHRDQFQHVSSLSGYLDPTWPGMYTAIELAMLDSAGAGAQIWNLWGGPLDPLRLYNDPTAQAVAGKYAGMPMYISASGGISGPRENLLKDPVGVISGITLEQLSRNSTAKFEIAARLSGAKPVVSYPITGVHSWSYWSDELDRARPYILQALHA